MTRSLKTLLAITCVAACSAATGSAANRDLGREVLDPDDGAAALGGEGVTGGSEDHDKTMLIGSSDNAPNDVGRLRITLHHNLFERIGQRAPRVRYGQVHIYNNYYKVPSPETYSYSWGVGFQPGTTVTSGIYAENNFFRTHHTVTPDQFLARFKGKAIFATGTLQNAAPDDHAVDPLAAYNEANDPDLSANVGWAPTLFLTIDPTFKVPSLIESEAGPFNW